MSDRKKEDILKKITKIMEENVEKGMNSEDINELIQQQINQYNENLSFGYPTEITEKTAKTSDDFLELAMMDEDITQGLKYLRKALKLDPNNYDAQIMLIDFTSEDDFDRTEKLKSAVERANENMKKLGYMDEENIGDFWGLIETRPYMRLRFAYMQALKMNGMLKKAIEECEEMLRLCESDNLGVRDSLAMLYVALEEKEKALNLYKKYDNFQSMLLPLSVLYFKLQDFKESKKYLDELVKVNKGTKEFLKVILEGEIINYFHIMEEGHYIYGTIEELAFNYMQNTHLYTQVESYFIWAYKQFKLKKVVKLKRKSKK